MEQSTGSEYKEGDKVIVVASSNPRIYLRESREWANLGDTLTIAAISKEKQSFYYGQSDGSSIPAYSYKVGFAECCAACRAKNTHLTFTDKEFERVFAQTSQSIGQTIPAADIAAIIQRICRFYRSIPGDYPVSGKVVWCGPFKYEIEGMGHRGSQVQITEIRQASSDGTGRPNGYFAFPFASAIPAHLVQSLLDYHKVLEAKLKRSEVLESAIQKLVLSLETYRLTKMGNNLPNEQKSTEKSEGLS